MTVITLSHSFLDNPFLALRKLKLYTYSRIHLVEKILYRSGAMNFMLPCAERIKEK